MSRGLVLVVDPVAERSRRLGALLGRSTDVITVTNGEEALELTLLRSPMVVCVALRVGAASGLDVALALRAVSMLEDAALVVYGPDLPGRRWSMQAKEQARARYSLDHFLPGGDDLRDVASVVWTELKERRKVQVAQAPQQGAEVRLQVESARVEPGSEVAPPLATVLKRDLSFQNLRVLLTTDLVAPSHQVIAEAELDDISWGELLRAHATLGNLRMALRKFTRSGGPSGGADDEER